ncbi:MAG: sigma-70 family RNA polymerase sigma factor [Bacteroidota bacterium]
MGMRELKISASITSRESISISKYLQEISKLPLISPEEEVYLTQLIREGDKTALKKLVNANLRFVVSVAKQYNGYGLSLPDLINEGNIGLIHAAEKFDPTRGFKFISFAVWWIRQSIAYAINEHARMIRVPVNKLMQKKSIERKQIELEQQLERTPSAEETAEAMNMETEDVQTALGWNGFHTSLDAPFSSDEENCLLDTIENDNASETDEKINYSESLQKELGRSLLTLDKRQREMICYLFGIGVDYPLSMDDVGRKYNLTTERVRQIRDKAITKLQTGRNANY